MAEPDLTPMPDDFWHRVAQDAGEAVLVLSKVMTNCNRVRDCLPYAVRESQASEWERKNAKERVEP